MTINLCSKNFLKRWKAFETTHFQQFKDVSTTVQQFPEIAYPSNFL